MDELKKLFEGTELSKDFLDKVSDILETKIEEERTAITEANEATIEEKANEKASAYSEYVVAEMEEMMAKYIEEELAPTVESYVDLATQEFVEENKLTIESQTKVDLAERFFKGIAEASTEFNVVIPEGQDDYVKKLETDMNEMNTRFDNMMKEKNQLQEQITQGRRKSVLDSVTEGLTETQKEKLTSVSENINFVDESQFKNAVKELKESYYPVNEDKNKLGAEDLSNMNEHKEQPSGGNKSQYSWLDDI